MAFRGSSCRQCITEMCNSRLAATMPHLLLGDGIGTAPVGTKTQSLGVWLGSYATRSSPAQRLAVADPSARRIRSAWRCAIGSPGTAQQAQDVGGVIRQHRSGALPAGIANRVGRFRRAPTAPGILRCAKPMRTVPLGQASHPQVPAVVRPSAGSRNFWSGSEPRPGGVHNTTLSGPFCHLVPLVLRRR
jgi:hypothetical protein